MKKFLPFSFLFFITFSLQAQTWEQRADLPDQSGRHHPVTWGIGDYGYSATGTNRALRPTADFFRYDPQLDSWDVLPDFPGEDRSFAIGTVYNGVGYLGFGASETAYLGDVWKYDPVIAEWDMVTVCPCEPRRHPSFVIIQDRLFVGLGDGPTGNLNDWWEYNLNTGIWKQHPNLPGPVRHHPFQFIAGDQVYAGMGHGNGVIYKDWYRFDIQNDQWMRMRNHPGEARVAGTQFDHNGYGYVLSGDGDDHNFMATGEFWKYDPAADEWEELPPHPGISRWAPGSFVVNDKVYFIGGQDRAQREIMFDMWEFPLATEPSSQRDLSDANSWEVFPNPFVNEISIRASITIERLELFNSTGQRIQVWESPEGVIYLTDLVPGSYILQALDADQGVSSKMIVKQ